MNASSASKSTLLVPESTHREAPADFVRWAVHQLPLTVAEEQNGWTIELDEESRAQFDGKESIRLGIDGNSTLHGAEPIAWSGRFAKWLQQRFKGRQGAMHVRPRVQPMSVNELSQALFSAYQVDEGSIHLAGCQLSDHPFLRLSFVDPSQPASPIYHTFVAPDGSSVSDEVVESLGLNELAAIEHAPPKVDDAPLRALIASGRRIAEKQSSSRDPTAKSVDPYLIAVVWVRHAEGHLRFTAGDASAELPFSGWAKLLQPKPFVGRDSGVATFHLAATDDGRIEAAEEIERCQQSGRAVLKQELVECSVTKQRVLPEYTEECPVTGLPALREKFAVCVHCRQKVSMAVLDDEDLCAACRHLDPIRRDDARLVWILGEHAGLDAWKRWRLAETASVYIAHAESFTKSLLVVVDKETLAVQRLATRGRLTRTWVDMPLDAQAELLR